MFELLLEFYPHSRSALMDCGELDRLDYRYLSSSMEGAWEFIMECDVRSVKCYYVEPDVMELVFSIEKKDDSGDYVIDTCAEWVDRLLDEACERRCDTDVR